MKTVRTVAEVRAHVAAARKAGRSVGLVPTMGAFHAGHHALMRAARGRCDEVVVWLFVNPTQFNEPSDLAAYPRDEAKDAAEAAGLGVAGLVARVGLEVRGLVELGGVDEQRDDDDVAVGAGGADQAEVALVEGAHRWHEADRAAGAAGLA